MSPETTPFGDPLKPFRPCAVLVSVASASADADTDADADAERAALLPLRHALAFGQTSSEVCDGAEWLQTLPKRLLERLKSTDHDSVVAVIYAGSGGDSDSVTVQAAAGTLRQCFGASLATLLVVACASSHQLLSVQEVSGFVVGASVTSAETARSVFLCLAMLSALKTMNGIDLTDLLPVLGSSTKPAYSILLRDGEGR